MGERRLNKRRATRGVCTLRVMQTTSATVRVCVEPKRLADYEQFLRGLKRLFLADPSIEVRRELLHVSVKWLSACVSASSTSLACGIEVFRSLCSLRERLFWGAAAKCISELQLKTWRQCSPAFPLEVRASNSAETLRFGHC